METVRPQDRVVFGRGAFAMDAGGGKSGQTASDENTATIELVWHAEHLSGSQ